MFRLLIAQLVAGAVLFAPAVPTAPPPKAVVLSDPPAPKVDPAPPVVPPAPKPKPAPPAVVAPTLTAPAVVQVDAGALFTIEAKTNCKWCQFVALDAGVTPFNIAALIEGAKPKVGVFVGTTPPAAAAGTEYKIMSYTGNATAGTQPVITRVVIKGTPPGPPGPTPPGPVPPGPTPPGPAPTPEPVTSFRVIFVTESGTTYPQSILSTRDGKLVADYLKANTTPTDGQPAGVRKYDPQENVTNESPTWKALWAAVQPKLPLDKPCVVVEVNGKAYIEAWPASPADALALFKKYTGK